MKEELEIQTVFDLYADQIYRLAYLYMHDEADASDIVQDVFLKWMKQDQKFKDEEHRKAWLLRVTHNTCKSRLRLFWRRKRVDLSEIKEVGITDPQSLDLIAHVMTLPDHYKIVIYLYYYEGYKETEIASLLDVNPSTIRSRMARARVMLKDCLEKEGYEYETRKIPQ